MGGYVSEESSVDILVLDGEGTVVCEKSGEQGVSMSIRKPSVSEKSMDR